MEDAIASLCSLTWFLAFICNKDVVRSARLCRVLHKMRVQEADGDLRFNKSCWSGRIATAIKEGSKNMLYMYVGGGAVDHEQSYMLKGLVVVCKTWEWAALAYAAARVASLACNNTMGPIDQKLMIGDGDGNFHPTTSVSLALDSFHRQCKSTWFSCQSCGDLSLDDLEQEYRSQNLVRTCVSRSVVSWLDRLKANHSAAVTSLVGDSV